MKLKGTGGSLSPLKSSSAHVIGRLLDGDLFATGSPHRCCVSNADYQMNRRPLCKIARQNAKLEEFPCPVQFQAADAIARLEQYRRMITLEEAVAILSGRSRLWPADS